MDTQSEESHNPAVRSSGKVRNNRAPLTVARLAACRFCKCLGFPLTYRNLYVVELALEAESNFSQVGIAGAAKIIMDAAMLDLQDGRCVNYFWFEDCCWRHPKLSFKEQDYLRTRGKARYY